MSTEYHQLPSQQGFMPSDVLTEDPWLIAATSNLSLSSDAWAPPKSSSKGVPIMPRSPLLFEHSGHDSAGTSIENGWKTVTSPGEMSSSPSTMTVGLSSSPALASPALSSSPIRGNGKSPMGMGGMGMGLMGQGLSSSMSHMPREFFSSSTSKLDAWSIPSPSMIHDLKRRPATGTPQPLKTSHMQIPQPLSLSMGDGETKAIEDELAIQNRYKTELCKSYTETGICRYGAKCQFAHGKDEVRNVLRHPKYKTETCKTFHSTGTCPYGTRCRFIHTRAKEESPLGFSDEELMLSGGLTPPPGIPVPQWSKSWSPTSSMPQKRFGSKKHGLGKITLVEAVPEY